MCGEEEIVRENMGNIGNSFYAEEEKAS